jgi:hypothetical protein
MVARDVVVGISIVLLFVMMTGLYAREKCRLGYVHWSICTMMGMPTVGVPFPAPEGPDPHVDR